MLQVISTKHLAPGEYHAPFFRHDDALRAIEHGPEVARSLAWTTETPGAAVCWAIVDRPSVDSLREPLLACIEARRDGSGDAWTDIDWPRMHAIITAHVDAELARARAVRGPANRPGIDRVKAKLAQLERMLAQLERIEGALTALRWVAGKPDAERGPIVAPAPPPLAPPKAEPDLACPACGVDHLEPPFELAPAPVVVITAGAHAGKIGPAVEWRRWNSPAWMGVVVGVDQDGFEINVHVAPCQLQKWNPATRRQVP